MLGSDAGRPEVNQDFEARRLWSLWDMLKEFSPKFVELHSQLARLQQKISSFPRSGRRQGVPQFLPPLLDGLREAINTIDLPAARIAISEFIEVVAAPDGVSTDDLMIFFDRVNYSVKTDLTSRVLLVVDADSSRFFRQETPLFGDEVHAKFLSIQYDIDEAGKCLALGRSTACAFHVLRSLEAGILAISRSLGIADPQTGVERNWSRRLQAIDTAINGKWTGAARLHGDGLLFAGFHAALAAMANPWRNATMHLDSKYTEDEARHIYDVINGFMRKIASRMDENGLPRA